MRYMIAFLLCSSFALAGCYESHTRAMERVDEPVSVVVACDPAPDTVVTGGSTVEAVACRITPDHEVDYTGVSMNISAEPRDSGHLSHGSGGTAYFMQFREFVRGRPGAMRGPFEDTTGIVGQANTGLIGGLGNIRLHAHETVDLVFGFTVSSEEDAPGELFSDGSAPTYAATWFNWGSVGPGITLGPSAFRLAESGTPGRRLREGEVTGDISGPRTRRFSVTRP